jgi:hypothetical protein
MGRVGLSRELLQARSIGAINISVFGLEIAGDAKPINPLSYLVHPKTICLGVMLGGLETGRLNEMTIDERMLRGDLGGGAPRDLASNATRL